MPTTHESALSHQLVELQGWYVDGLRPKLIRAAGSGTVEPADAVELDRRLCELLRLADGDDAEAA